MDGFFLAATAFAAALAHCLIRLILAFRRARFFLILSCCVICGAVDTIKRPVSATKKMKSEAIVMADSFGRNARERAGEEAVPTICGRNGAVHHCATPWFRAQIQIL